MGCPEIRKQLSSYADGALGTDERGVVVDHLAQCSACRRELDEQGALDMLLKKHYDAAPPPGSMDAFWPTVEQRIEGEGAGGGGGPDEEIVFKSSPALKLLNIPDRKPPEPEALAPQVSAPVAPPQQPQTSYRWPVAFVLAVGLATGGILVHKKLNPTLQPPAERTGTISAPGGAADPEAAAQAASQPAAAGGAMAVASAAGNEGTTAGEGETPGEGEDVADESAAPGSAKGAPRRAAKRPRQRGKEPAGEKPAAAKGDETAPAEPAAAAPAKPVATGKRTDLDSLIDDAIGTKAAAKAAKATPAPAPAPGAGLPDQLNMNQIREGMRKVTGLVQACYDKFQIEGKATVALSITPAGEVRDATVKGKFFGSDTGTCVVTAVKKASFPKFSGKAMSITYPFILQ